MINHSRLNFEVELNRCLNISKNISKSKKVIVSNLNFSNFTHRRFMRRIRTWEMCKPAR